MSSEPGAGTPPPQLASSEALQRLVESINEAGRHVTTVTFTFVGIVTYVWVTVATIHDVDLLVGRLVELPLLGAKVPLKPFFFFVPIFVFVFHFYLLMQLAHLEKRVATLLRLPHLPSGDRDSKFDRHSIDRSVFFFPFLGFDLYFGKRTGREARYSKSLNWLIFLAYLGTYAVVPILTLGLIQNGFLGYRHFWLTLWHGIVILSDIGLSALLIRSHSDDSRTLPGPPLKQSWRFGGASVLVLAEIVVLMTIPTCGDLPWLMDRVVGRSLTVTDVDLVEQYEGPIVLRRRDLRCADLSGSNLQGANLQGANLEGAVLRNTNLRQANMLPRSLSEKEWKGREGRLSRLEVEKWHSQERMSQRTSLRGADLWLAKLEGAQLAFVLLDDVNAGSVRLQFADLTGVTARKAQLSDADLTGAVLDQADLRQALFENSQLVGASLRRVHAEGAGFWGATLDLVDFSDAHLEFATLVGADLRGAILEEASISGADLRGADLSGARHLELRLNWVTGADTQGASVAEGDSKTPRLADIRGTLHSELGRWDQRPLLQTLGDTAREFFRYQPAKVWKQSMEERLKESDQAAVHGMSFKPEPRWTSWSLMMDPSIGYSLASRDFERRLAKALLELVLKDHEAHQDSLLPEFLCRRARGDHLLRDPSFEKALLEELAQLPDKPQIPRVLKACAAHD